MAFVLVLKGDDVMELWVEPIEERPCGLVIGISAVVL
jgi:hypothetical protein